MSGETPRPQGFATASEVWIEESVVPRFKDHILDVAVDIAERWGCLLGDGATKGRAPFVTDSMIAATALSRGMAMVTRNVNDFQFEGLTVDNVRSRMVMLHGEATLLDRDVAALCQIDTDFATEGVLRLTSYVLAPRAAVFWYNTRKRNRRLRRLIETI